MILRGYAVAVGGACRNRSGHCLTPMIDQMQKQLILVYGWSADPKGGAPVGLGPWFFARPRRHKGGHILIQRMARPPIFIAGREHKANGQLSADLVFERMAKL